MFLIDNNNVNVNAVVTAVGVNEMVLSFEVKSTLEKMIFLSSPQFVSNT